MSISDNKKHSLTLTKTLTLIVTLILILSVTLTLPKSASAASKEYEVYKKIKLGMNVTEVAKAVYGKKYKSHLKTEFNIKTMDSSFEMRDIQKDYKYYSFRYYPYGKDPVIMNTYKMTVTMKTKQKGNTLYVAEKSFYNPDYSTYKFYKNKKPKNDMSWSQMDKIMQGKGIGSLTSHYTRDYSKIGEIVAEDGKLKVVYSPKDTWLSYHASSYDGKKKYLILFQYDYKKKRYSSLL